MSAGAGPVTAPDLPPLPRPVVPRAVSVKTCTCRPTGDICPYCEAVDDGLIGVGDQDEPGSEYR